MGGEGLMPGEIVGRVMEIWRYPVRSLGGESLAQGDLPQDPAILESVRHANGTRAGIYATVQQPGPFAIGDPVRLLSDSAA
jgi:uncharacterized protein YcbX